MHEGELMSRWLALHLIPLLVLWPLFGQAQTQRISLNIQSEFQAGDIVRLKQEIQRQGRIDLNRFDLESVTVLAKSFQGRGVIALQVGRDQSRSGFIPGNPRDFRDPYPSTFTPVYLQAQRGQDQGNWLLSFQGRIYVQNITVNLRPSAYRPTPPTNRPPPWPGNPFPAPNPPIQFTSQGEFRLEKFIESSRSYRVRENNVKVIRIQALKNDANISQARAVLSNGQEIFLDSLTGHLKEGRVAQFAFPSFNGVNVQSVYFSGTTSSLVGSRADLKVEVGLLRY